jgi:DNA polymerase III subunit epsilon
VSARQDPATLLAAPLRVDASRRSAEGIRISLPLKGGTPVTPAAVRAALAKVAPRRKVVRERPRTRYGAGWAGPPEAAPPDTDLLRTLEYVVVDVETTGGAAEHGHRITEVCAVRVDGAGRVAGEFATLVNPERPIPPVISALTRISSEMVERAPRFEEIAADLRSFLEGAVFVAHNAAFDWRFIGSELVRAGQAPPIGRVLCTVRLARKVVPEVSRRSLDALSWFFGVPNEARHRAFGDARATARILTRLLDRVDEREIFCWGELETLMRRRAPRRKRRASPEPVRDA